ncbi:MAG: hypothetical protein AB8D52_10685 [Gammaproteobacteria bacterium]
MNSLKIKMLFIAPLLSFTFDTAFATFNEGYLAYKDNNYQLAYEKWHKDANNGDAGSQFALGLLFYEGKGVEKNFKQAFFGFIKLQKMVMHLHRDK